MTPHTGMLVAHDSTEWPGMALRWRDPPPQGEPVHGDWSYSSGTARYDYSRATPAPELLMRLPEASASQFNSFLCLNILPSRPHGCDTTGFPTQLLCARLPRETGLAQYYILILSSTCSSPELYNPFPSIHCLCISDMDKPYPGLVTFPKAAQQSSSLLSLCWVAECMVDTEAVLVTSVTEQEGGLLPTLLGREGDDEHLFRYGWGHHEKHRGVCGKKIRTLYATVDPASCMGEA